MTKAWIPNRDEPPWDDDRILLVHADTRGKAQRMVADEVGCDFIEARVERWPAMDDLPDTMWNMLRSDTCYWVECQGCYRKIYNGAVRPDGVAINSEKDATPYSFPTVNDPKWGEYEDEEAEPRVPHRVDGIGLFCTEGCWHEHAAKHGWQVAS